jgi:hypothetical protein
MPDEYPQSVAEVLDPPVRFRSSTVAAARRFAKARPWRGSIEERQAKFLAAHADLCRIYGLTTTLRFGTIDESCSGLSSYCPSTNEIVIRGRLSVTTLFHELAHALGRDERGAVRWSVNLFRVAFPRSFSRATADGHMLRAESRQG